MLWSELFIPTLRENPAGADSVAGRLLMRAGYLRPGVFLPLAQRSLRKIERIIRIEMESIGAQEIALDAPSRAATTQLPQIWFQIQHQILTAKLPDLAPLARMLTNCGLSNDFIVASESGADTLVNCLACGYKDSLEYAVSNPGAPAIPDPEGDPAMEEFHTPNRKTIADVSEFTGLPATTQMKSLVMTAGGVPVLALVRGDHQLSRPKLAAIMASDEAIPAGAAEITRLFGADPGSLGPVAVKNIRIIADQALSTRRNMTTGANRNDYHLRNVTPGRDFMCEFADIRRPTEGDTCQTCGSPLTFQKATRLAGVSGTTATLWLDRILYTIAEQNNDEAGMILPRSIAPFDVILTPVNNADAVVWRAAQKVYRDCENAGLGVLYDDRDDRPGSKFKDADLTGIPWRVTVGKKLAQGVVELANRKTRTATDIEPSAVASALK